MVRLLFVVLLAVATCGGCATVAPMEVRTAKGSLGISWSANTRHGLKGWLEAHERALGRPVLLLKVHGGRDEDGVWCIWPDWPRPSMPVEHAAWVLLAVAEGRQVVIQSCNEAGDVLYVPGVLYARQVCSAAPGHWFPGWTTSPRQFVVGSRRP